MTGFQHPVLDPVVAVDGVIRHFQTADGKRHLWPSNFFARPLHVGGVICLTVEHYYQAMKSLDQRVRDEILAAPTAGAAKTHGRSVVMRPDWEQIKDTVMLSALHEKFQPGTDLAEALLGTGDTTIIEGNTWHDNVWGDCSCGRPGCSAPGENRLGRMLMRRRSILQEVEVLEVW